jgi:pyruvate dehydrogenase (quinone)/pyruvate oxidase
MGMRYQQEVDLLSLFKDVSVFNQQVMGPAHAHALVDAACRAALGARGVAHINCCNDWQEKSTSDEEPSQSSVQGHTSKAWTPPIVVPQAESLASAAALLNGGKRTVILVGQGALGAGDELEQVADVLGAPIVKALLGKAVVPDDSPFTTGGIGLLGTLPSELAMEECDTLLIAGSSFPYMQYLPEPDHARAVQIDRDPTRIGLRYPIDIGLTGDAKATLGALLPQLKRRQDRSFLEKAQGRMKDWRELMRTREGRDDVPIKPQVIARHVNDLLADNAIVTTDSGTITTWAARHIHIRRGMMFSCSGNLATMAPGLPYANGAQVAFPDRQVVAFVGDGGFAMLMMEFVTAVKHKLPIKVVIIKNNTLGQIKWEQMVFLGNPEYGVELQPIDFVQFARACGAVGFHCEKPEEVRPVLEAAFSAKGPALVEAVVDPFEPPLPARATFKQGLHMAEALARSEPHRGRIALTLFRDKMKEWS